MKKGKTHVDKDSISRETCRVCESKDVSDLFSLGNLYVSNFVERGETGIKAPLNMMFCNNCSLVQLKDTVPRELLYSGVYWYKSGVTQIMKNALRDITQKAEENFGLESGDVVLDIGSNDGTLLRTYSSPGIIKVGVEPATSFVEEGKKGLEYFINGLWDSQDYEKTVGKKAKIITAISMMYDLEEPNKFVSDVSQSLRQDGVFISQLMCLKSMLDANDVGNICHEHLEYYSFNSLEHLLNQNGLEIFDIEVNEINGGSYRVYSKLKEGDVKIPKGASERVNIVKKSEESLQDKKTLMEFYDRIKENKKKCVEFIRGENQRGKNPRLYQS